MERPTERADRVYLETRSRFRLLTGLVNGLTAGILLVLAVLGAALWRGDASLATSLGIFLVVLLVIKGLVLLEVPDARKRFLDAVRIRAGHHMLETADSLTALRGTETSWAEASKLVDVLERSAEEHPQVAQVWERVRLAVREYRRGQWTRTELAEHLREHGDRLLLGKDYVEVQKEEP